MSWVSCRYTICNDMTIATNPSESLNALANHGYLPRSGVATPLEFDTAIETVPRIGVIFSQILAFYVCYLRFLP